MTIFGNSLVDALMGEEENRIKEKEEKEEKHQGKSESDKLEKEVTDLRSKEARVAKPPFF